MVRIVHYRSRQPALHTQALGIFAACLSNNIRIEPEWIRRNENKLADYYSCIFDYDDNMLHPVIFYWLDRFLGASHSGQVCKPKKCSARKISLGSLCLVLRQ